MSSSKYMLWVARALTVLMFTTLSAITGGISPASAEEPFNPSAPVVNDPAGTSQDWFMVTGDGQTYSYYWNADGTNGIPQGSQVSVATGGGVTVYARHYQGTVKAFLVSFTNAAGASAPNTVTFANPVCDPMSGGTSYEVYWNQTYDGTGLVSYRPGFFVGPESGVYRIDRTSRPDLVLGDGQSIRLDTITTPDAGVWLEPGWQVVSVVEFHRPEGASGYFVSSTARLWVNACGTKVPPAGQVSPDGVLQPPGSGGDDGPATDTSRAATGKLTLLRKQAKVKATAINRKVGSRTTFKLKRPGVRKALVIRAPAGDVVVKKVKTLKPGKYVLTAKIKVNGQLRFKPVATLVVRR